MREHSTNDADDAPPAPATNENADALPAPATNDAADAVPAHSTTDGRPTLAATVVVSRERPAECTIYPADVPETERTTTWITAREGSFVSLEAAR